LERRAARSLSRRPQSRPFPAFVDVLEAHAEVVTLDALRDYRQEQAGLLPVYLMPLDERTAARIDDAWRRLVAGRQEMSAEVTVKGRRIEVPRAAGRAARFDFADLCRRPLAARDFLALAERFDTFVVENVPRMDS